MAKCPLTREDCTVDLKYSQESRHIFGKFFDGDRVKSAPNKQPRIRLVSDNQGSRGAAGSCRIPQCTQRRTGAAHEKYGMSCGWFLPVSGT